MNARVRSQHALILKLEKNHENNLRFIAPEYNFLCKNHTPEKKWYAGSDSVLGTCWRL